MSIEDHLLERVKEKAKACEVFSNVQRSLIAYVVNKYDEIPWTELKNHIEEVRGPINPNTLSFHLKKLIEENIIQRGGTDGQPSYMITENGKMEVEQKLGGKREMVG